jgi:hypothetical protein
MSWLMNVSSMDGKTVQNFAIVFTCTERELEHCELHESYGKAEGD